MKPTIRATPAFGPVFLLLQGLAAGQAPILSPISFLPGDSSPAPAAGDQRRPAVALGGNQVLAVWQDARTDLAANYLPDEGGWDIFAARLDPAGSLVDAVSIPVSQDEGDQTGPKVAWNGSNWLVAWTGEVASAFYFTTAIQAVRVSPQGVVLDDPPLTVLYPPDTSNPGELFGVASDGANWLVAWKVWTGTAWAVQGRRIAPQGAFLDASPVTLHGTFQWQPSNGDVVFAADEYLVVWQEWMGWNYDDLFGKRLSPGLAPLGGVFPIHAGNEYDVHPSIATDGDAFFAVWETYNNCCVGGGGRVFGTRITHAGQVLDPSGILISATTSTTSGRAPAVCWDGSQWIASWSYDGAAGPPVQILAGRISAAGVALDPGGFPVGPTASFQTESAVAGAIGGGAHVLWTDKRSTPWLPYPSLPFDVYGAYVPPSGSPGPDSCVSVSAPAQVAPSLAPDGSGTLVVFESAVSGAQRILGQRVDPFGIALDPEPFEIEGFSVGLHHPAVAWNGSLWLAVWEDTSQAKIFGKRIGPAGTVLDATPILVMPGITADVAAVGGDFLVVGTHTTYSPEVRVPFARRVRGSDGALLDPAPILLGSEFAQSPKVAAFGTRWVVAWQRNFSHDDIHANIHAAFLESDGTISANLLVAGPYTMSLNAAAVASDGNAALVAWSSNLYSGNIQARLLLPTGSMLPPFSLSAAPQDQSLPAVGWDGAEYVAAWQDLRNVTYFWDDRDDLYGARLDPNGILLDPSGFAIADGPTPEIHPAVAGSGGSAAIAGARFRDLPPFAAYRLGIRIEDPPGCGGATLAYGSGCPGSGGFTPAYALAGCPAPGSPVGLQLSGGLGGSLAILGFGVSQASVPVPGGCTLLLDPLIPWFPTLLLGGVGPGTGAGTFFLGVPPGTSGAVVTTQAFVLDPGVPQGFSNSNGIQTSVQ